MAMDADYSFELIFVETYAPQFIGHNKFFLGSVTVINLFDPGFYFAYFFDFSVYVAIAIRKLEIQQSFSLILIQPTYWNSKNN